MDGVVLINGITVGSSGGGPKRISRVVSGVRGLWCIASFFRTRFFSIFFDVGSILGGFGEAKTEAKIDFWEVFLRCFFRMRFGIDFGWIFGGSEP